MKHITTHSRVFKKFLLKFESTEIDISHDAEPEIKFHNETTQLMWLSFLSGWMSHPQTFASKYVSVIGKLAEDGKTLTFSKQPRLHGTNRVHGERDRLQASHGDMFVIFTCSDPKLCTPFFEARASKSKPDV